MTQVPMNLFGPAYLVHGKVVPATVATSLNYYWNNNFTLPEEETLLTVRNDVAFWLVPNNDNTFTVLSEL